MPVEENNVIVFTTRVRQMILQYREIRQENNDLVQKLNQQNEQIAQLQAQLQQAQYDYQSLKMAKMIEITDGDMDKAKVRLSKLIRDVNKCITLLSEK